MVCGKSLRKNFLKYVLPLELYANLLMGLSKNPPHLTFLKS